LLGLFLVALSVNGQACLVVLETQLHFVKNLVKVSPDALMNGECGISATYSAVGDLAGPNRPPISEVRLRSPARPLSS
jgi:hypothetical protein